MTAASIKFKNVRLPELTPKLRIAFYIDELTTHAAVATAHAGNAARAVAATHEALARTYWRVGAMLLDRVAGRTRIVRAIAAGIEMDLGLGGAQGAEHQCDGNE
jgi:hypothetical protein